MKENMNKSSFGLGLGIAAVGALLYFFFQSMEDSDAVVNSPEPEVEVVEVEEATTIILNDSVSPDDEGASTSAAEEPVAASDAPETTSTDVTEPPTKDAPKTSIEKGTQEGASTDTTETENPNSETQADPDPQEATAPIEQDSTETVTQSAETTTEQAANSAEPTTEPTPSDPVEEAKEPATENNESVTELSTDEPEPEIVLEGDAPEFDLVRVDDTGTAVIAGTAEPNTLVTILLDGEKIGEAIASSSGEFVAIVQTPEKETGQAIELATEVNGQPVFSNESIFILPTLSSAAAESAATETAPSIIRASGEGVVIVQSAGMLLLDQISLDSISYDEDGEVILAGRGNPGNGVIVYVDDAAIKETVISDSGSWKTVLQDLRAGRYVLRVDEIDADGTVNSRAESPFQRAFPQEVREARQSGQSTYIVQPGNSLWIIATGKYGEGLKYHQILSANKDQIRDPDLIYPGQVFDIPEAAE